MNTAKKYATAVDAVSFMKLDLLLTPQQAELRRRVRRTCETFVEPLVPSLVENASFDDRLVEAAKLLGPAGFHLSSSEGSGMSMSDAMILTMEIARCDASFATFYLVHCGLAMKSIDAAGSYEQRQYWLPRMERLEVIGAFGLTEPDFGSDASSLATTARKVDGGWILNGRKRWIGNATFADVTVVWARASTTGEIDGFLVEKHFRGFHPSKIEHKMSLRGVQNADIELIDCFVPDANHLTGATTFSSATRRVLQSSRAVVCAAAVGTLLGAYDRAAAYVTRRRQFGQPLAAFQLVQERLMRVLGTLQAGILLCVHLGAQIDKEMTDMAQIALSKAWTTRVCREGVALCREVLGGNGIVLDFGVMAPFIDMESLYTYEGTYDINSLLAARGALQVSSLGFASEDDPAAAARSDDAVR